MAQESVFGSSNYVYGGGVGSSCIQFGLYSNKADGGIKANTWGNNTPLNQGENNITKNLFRGLVAQTLRCGIQKQPKIVYELGTTKYYSIDSRPQGQGQLDNIFGPSDSAFKTLKSLGDICNPCHLVVQIVKCQTCTVDGSGNSNTVKAEGTPLQTLVFKGGFLSSVSVTASAADLTAQGSWGFTFQDLAMDTTPAAAAAKK